MARLGAPIVLLTRESVSRSVGVASQGSRSYVFCDLRPHIISLGNNGALKTDGTYGTSEEDVKEIFSLISRRLDDGGSTPIKHLLLYAHGGLTAEDSAIQKVADLRPALFEAGVFPISLIWRSDLWTTLRNILQDAISRRRQEGFLDSGKDFMLDRLDDGLEPIARAVGGRRIWAEMQQNALLASQRGGSLLVVLNELRKLVARHQGLALHLVGHSAGSILLGGLAGANQAGGRPVVFDTCTMWAPACTMEFYREQYVPAIRGGSLKQYAIFTLTDRAEQDDDCANIYHKSLLYLVSHAFEKELRKPWFPQERRRAAPRHGEVPQQAAGAQPPQRLGAVAERPARGAPRSIALDHPWRVRRRPRDVEGDPGADSRSLHRASRIPTPSICGGAAGSPRRDHAADRRGLIARLDRSNAPRPALRRRGGEGSLI